MPIPDYWPDIKWFGPEERRKFVTAIRQARAVTFHPNGCKYTNADLYREVIPFHHQANIYRASHISREKDKAVIICLEDGYYGDVCNDELKDICKKKGLLKPIPGYLAWLCWRHPDRAQALFDEVIKAPFRPCDPSIPAASASLSPFAAARQPIDTSALQAATINHADNLLHDHERHDLEDDFSAFKEEHTSGYWHLSAGPGMGKSHIVASLFRRYGQRAEHVAVGHFFKSDGTSPAGNSFELFYRNVLTALGQAYAIDIDVPDEHDARIARFRETIYALSRAVKIAPQRPLLLFIDAIDEITPHARMNPLNDNVLELPPQLPQGVYVILSVRQSPAGAHDTWLHDAPVNYRSVVIDKANPPFFEPHKATLKRYVHRTCGSKLYISEYHRVSSGHKSSERKDGFVEQLCERAGHNFMILRAVLHDQSFWESGENIEHLSSDLNRYYRQQFKRMRNSDPSVDMNAIFCLALRPSISFGTFVDLVSAVSDRDVPQAVLNAIERWRNQGFLLQSRRVDKTTVLSVYHSSFRDYLKGELDGHPREAILEPFANRIRHIFLRDDANLRLIQMAPVVIDERCALLATLHVEANCLLQLETVLADLQFWRACARATRGVTVVFDHLKRIWSVSNRQDISDLLDRVANRLLHWTAHGELQPIHDTDGGLGQLHDISLSVELGRRFDESLSLSQALSRMARASVAPDADRETKIQMLFGAMKEERRKNNIQEAWKISRKIERELKPEEGSFWSRLRYDQGMFYHIDGKYADSVSFLAESSRIGFETGDMIKGLNSRYRQVLNQYLNDQILVDTLYSDLIEIHGRLQCLQDATLPSPRLLVDAIYNVTVTAGQVAFDAAPAEFEFWHERVLKLQYTQDCIIMEPAKRNPNYEYFRLQSIARYHQVQGRFAQAASIFASILGVDLKSVQPSDLRGFEAVIRPLARDEALEICRDYRDLARALIAIGTEQARQDAMAVWKRAEKFPDTRGNGYFLRQMQNDRSKVL